MEMGRQVEMQCQWWWETWTRQSRMWHSKREREHKVERARQMDERLQHWLQVLV